MAQRPVWLNDALELQRAGRLNDAERICTQALVADPSEADALHLSAIIAAHREQWEVAGGFLARAIGAQPNRADFYASFGNLFFARGQMAQMTECYRRALVLDYFRVIPASFADIAVYAGSDPPPSNFPTDLSRYTSQYFQDVLLDRWVFGGMADGVFVDIGAHDGITLSNSYFFETVRGWRGVCVEPNPDVFVKLAANRRCNLFNCAVSDRTGTVPFIKISGYAQMLSGLAETYDAEHRQRIERELKQFGGSSETISIPARTLNELASDAGLSEITYLSIDTEGSELAILHAIDFSQLLVHAITVECNYDHLKSQMTGLMRERGFDFAQSLGHDLLFLNRASPFQAQFQRAQKRL